MSDADNRGQRSYLILSLEPGVTDSCKPWCGYLELNPGPLQEQVLLTTEHLFISFDYSF